MTASNVKSLLSQPRIETLVQLVSIISPEFKIVLQRIFEVTRCCWHMIGHVDSRIVMVGTNLGN